MADHDPVPPPPGPPSEPDAGADERRYPSTIGGGFYLLILATMAVGIAVVWFGSWRDGVRVLAGAVLAGSLLRVVLPQRDAGMLAVRNRIMDAAILAAVGVALIFLAATIPNQPR